MGLYSDLNTALVDAFDNDLSDAIKILSLKHKRYNYNTTEGCTDEDSTTTPTRGAMETVSHDFVDGETIKATDTQFTIIQSELAVTPEPGDFIMFGEIEYHINSSIPDPAGATWLLIGRRV